MSQYAESDQSTVGTADMPDYNPPAMAQYAESDQSTVETSDIQDHEDGTLDNIKIEISLASVLCYLNVLFCTIYVATGFVFLMLAVDEYLHLLVSQDVSSVRTLQTLARVSVLEVVTGILTFVFMLEVVNLPHTGFHDYCKKSWHLANWWFLTTLSVTSGVVMGTYVLYCIDGFLREGKLRFGSCDVQRAATILTYCRL